MATRAKVMPVMCAMLMGLGSAALADSAPKEQDIHDDLPAQVQELFVKLADPDGLGGRVYAVYHADGLEAAIALIVAELEDCSQHGTLIRFGEGGYLALIHADLASIEKGELEQGKLIEDSGWKDGRRTLVLKIDGVKVRLTQLRAGSPARQTSTYYWRHWLGSRGDGRDSIAPVVGVKGERPCLHLIASTYSSNHGDAEAEIRDALSKWKRLAEKFMTWCGLKNN